MAIDGLKSELVADLDHLAIAAGPAGLDHHAVAGGQARAALRAGEIDTSDTQSPQRTFADRYDTRKSIDHQQAGLQWQQNFGANRLQLTVYGGNREVIQYQSFSRAFQAPATHSGGVVDFDRDFHGVDLNWRDVRTLAGGTLRTTIGLEYASSKDARQGYENFVGDQFGVRGRLRRDDDEA